MTAMNDFLNLLEHIIETSLSKKNIKIKKSEPKYYTV